MQTKPEQDLSPLKRALIAVKDMREKLEAAEHAQKEPIAIVGMACRFPGPARDIDGYWDVLKEGVDAVGEIPPDRWDINAYYDPDPAAAGKMYTREGGFIQGIDKFDADFFGITPREAVRMDPQQRLLLETSWHALESAGIDPKSLKNSLTGVFVGISTNEYMQLGLKQSGPDWIDAYTGTGGALSVAAGRLSYFLGLHGPTVSLDTACSSSLVAIDLAVTNLRAGKCSLALAGGVNLMLSPESSVYLCKVQALSPGGRCKAFDESGDGYGRGEGCGLIILKRMRDALADGDRILAVILGSASNHDGQSGGLTVPNGAAQKQVIRASLADARIEPSQVNYIEAHGTGTSLGDPIEMRALDSVFKQNQELLIGTAKTNIGHLESAAGVAAVIKVVLAMQHGLIPPNLHFNQPSTHIPWDKISMRVLTEPTPWPENVAAPIAGVSSFGFSGTNAHLILQAAPQTDRSEAPVERPLHLLPLSARNEEALNLLATRYENHLRRHDTQSVADICYTAGVGRSHFRHRMALLAGGPEELAERLHAYARGESVPGLWRGESIVSERSPKIAFMFTGQGSQYLGMGRALYETQPTFRKILDACDALLRPHWKQSLLSVLYPNHGEEVEAEKRLHQTEVTQPALFAVEYALAQLWRSWGIDPSVVMGHSVGEYVAACVAGVFSLEDGLKLIRERGRLMQSLPGGGRMVAVFAGLASVTDYISGYEDTVSVAAINGPLNTVISGAGGAIEAILKRLKADGVRFHALNVSHAFHSPLMDPILDSFEKVASGIVYAAPDIKFISNLTGQPAGVKDLEDSRWWRQHIRQPVRFEPSVTTMSAMGIDLFLEIGPNPILLGMAKSCMRDKAFVGFPSLRQGRDAWPQMLESLANFYVKGCKIDWQGFDRDYRRYKMPLPDYPFQRTHHWLPQKDAVDIQPPSLPGGYTVGGHPLVGERLQSPVLKDIVFRSRLSVNRASFLSDHKVFGLTVFPMAGFFEMAVSAAQEAFGARYFDLRQLSIEEPLILDDEPFELQIVISPEEEKVANLRIFSTRSGRPQMTQPWNQHVSAQVYFTDQEEKIPGSVSERWKELQTQPEAQRDVARYYREMDGRGIEYGEAFRSVVELWEGAAEGLGHIRIPPILKTEPDVYRFHPVLLDGCLQVLGVYKEQGEDQGLNRDVYLPTTIGRIRVWNPLRSACWSHARFSVGLDETQSEIQANIRIHDENGVLAAEITNLILKRADHKALRQAGERRLDEWLYHIDWQPQNDHTDIAEPVADRGGRWLVFADRQGVGEALVKRLQAIGDSCLTIHTGRSFQDDGNGHYRVAPGNMDDFERLLTRVLENGSPPILGVVHLWSLECDQATDDVSALEMALPLNCASVLCLVQGLRRFDVAPPFQLFLVTRGAQPAGAEQSAPGVLQTPLWGLGRVIAREHPELGCTQIDLDPADVGDASRMLFAELRMRTAEDQLAYRNNVRYVARLVRRSSRLPMHRHQLPEPRSEAYRLVIKQKGLLESLEFEGYSRKPPGPGKVEIRVLMSSLNFRDVLNALGMYPGEGIPLGSECVGEITSIGEGVQGHRVGDKVIALAEGGFGNYVHARADWLMAKPEGLSDEEAATIPIVFLTAYYGLIRLAGMKKGDRVLIHAAAGGVGMAAVQLAQWVGAEVYATAGSDEKQQLLKSMGVDHVMHSRRLDFADEIMAATQGQGVDIVLNALIGDFITKSLSVLAPGGRFLELGKVEIWDDDKVARVNPTCRYTAFDLSAIILDEPALVDEMYRDILAGFQSRHLHPLPSHLFPLENAIGAFRFMAQARHMGKIVLSPTFPSSTGGGEDSDRMRSDAAYLITGGLGGIGLEIAEWLVQNGARHLILMGRSAPQSKSLEAIRQLEKKDVSVEVFQGDVSCQADIQRLFAGINSSGGRLCGIVHAAGVIDDGVLVEQGWPRFQSVLAPKAIGAWLLHHYSQDAPLDFFVLFSSVASILGNAGQSNYATANAFLDGLAHFRRAGGMKAVSINWGPWQAIGMTAAQGGIQRSKLAAAGIDLIAPDQGKHVFGRLIKDIPEAQMIVLPVKWPVFLRSHGVRGVPPLLRTMAEEQMIEAPNVHENGAKDELIEKLAAATDSERHDIMISVVSQKVAKVMGVDSPASLDVRMPFTNLGLDSLMAVELKNELTVIVGRNLQTSLVYDYPTIEGLVSFLVAMIREDKPDAERTGGPAKSAKIPAQDNAWGKKSQDLDAFSPDEVAKLLAEKIASVDRMDSE